MSGCLPVSDGWIKWRHRPDVQHVAGGDGPLDPGKILFFIGVQTIGVGQGLPSKECWRLTSCGPDVSGDRAGTNGFSCFCIFGPHGLIQCHTCTNMSTSVLTMSVGILPWFLSNHLWTTSLVITFMETKWENGTNWDVWDVFVSSFKEILYFKELLRHSEWTVRT